MPMQAREGDLLELVGVVVVKLVEDVRGEHAHGERGLRIRVDAELIEFGQRISSDLFLFA